MCAESDIKLKLLARYPYKNSIKANPRVIINNINNLKVSLSVVSYFQNEIPLFDSTNIFGYFCYLILIFIFIYK